MNFKDEELSTRDLWGPFLAAAAFAIRSTLHTILKATPAQLVFGRDMLLPVQFTADWAAIQAMKQKEVNRNNAKENTKRIPHQYVEGERVLLKVPGTTRKFDPKRKGPYTIERVYDNGTLRIRRGAITERINIRRVLPYFE